MSPRVGSADILAETASPGSGTAGSSTPAPPGGALPESGDAAAGPGGRWRARGLLAAALACAACGIVYELGLINLATALVGSSLRSTSLVLGIFVFAMGIGSLAAKRLTSRPLTAFVGIEVALAAIGGTSGLVLYESFARFGSYEGPVLVLAALVGGLIGAEIPLLMELLQRLRARRASDDAADVMAADYVGALVAGVAFPFLLVPAFGLVRSSLATGLVNVVAAAIVVVAVGVADRRRALLGAGALAVGAAFLVTGLLRAEGWVVSARQRLYDDPVVAVVQTRYQEIVLTSSRGRFDDVRLYLNGDLQFSTVDEHRYHEALVHPVMGGGPHRRVLVLGGGDGLAVREILRYPTVEEVVVVELDAAVTDFAAERPEVVAANGGALRDPRVSLVHDDAFAWAHDRARAARGTGSSDDAEPAAETAPNRAPEGTEPFDVVIVDLPDPDSLDLARLYSVEMYSAVRSLVAPGGRMVVQAGSPYFAPDAFWCVRSTVEAAGFSTEPYHVDVPSFGDWGFVAAVPAAPASPAARPASASPAELDRSGADSGADTGVDAGGGAGTGGEVPLRIDPAIDAELRFMNDGMLEASRVFPDDVVRPDPPPSTLVEPRIATYTAEGWNAW